MSFYEMSFSKYDSIINAFQEAKEVSNMYHNQFIYVIQMTDDLVKTTTYRISELGIVKSHEKVISTFSQGAKAL